MNLALVAKNLLRGGKYVSQSSGFESSLIGFSLLFVHEEVLISTSVAISSEIDDALEKKQNCSKNWYHYITCCKYIEITLSINLQ